MPKKIVIILMLKTNFGKIIRCKRYVIYFIFLHRCTFVVQTSTSNPNHKSQPWLGWK